MEDAKILEMLFYKGSDVGFWCEPDLITYTEFIREFCIRGNIKDAEELYARILKSGLLNDHVPVQILFNMYCKLGEKDMESKLDMFFKKSLYTVAINLVQTQQADVAATSEILRKYGDHLYSKQDYDEAMSQYIHTIGHLEPTYVIQKFLDATRPYLRVSAYETVNKIVKCFSGFTTSFCHHDGATQNILKHKRFRPMQEENSCSCLYQTLLEDFKTWLLHQTFTLIPLQIDHSMLNPCVRILLP